MIQRYRLNRTSVTNKKGSYASAQKCSKVTVHAYNNDKWGSRLASQSGDTEWWWYRLVVLVQSGHKLLAPTQSRRSSGDRAAGGGSRINKEEEKVDNGSRTRRIIMV